LTRSNVQDKVDRLNEATQAIIGAKEAVVKAIINKAGARVTNAILCSADGADHKSIDKYELYKLVNTLMQGAERTSITEVCKHTIDLLQM